MGLDTYATEYRADGKWHPAPDEPFAGIHMVGGVFSGGSGSSSMRGKVYENVVFAATGETLHQLRIGPAAVAEMTRRLRAAVDEAMRVRNDPAKRKGWLMVDDEGEYWLDQDGELRTKADVAEFPVIEVAGEEIEPERAEHLARWFEVCAEHGYAIEGWW